MALLQPQTKQNQTRPNRITNKHIDKMKRNVHLNRLKSINMRNLVWVLVSFNITQINCQNFNIIIDTSHLFN